MGTYTPDELNETESFDSGDLENRALDDSTYEPGLQVETSGDFEMSEKIESELKNLMENISMDYMEDVRLNIEDLLTSAEAKLNEIKVEITTAGVLPEGEESISTGLEILKSAALSEDLEHG
ncbi:MAG: hypothetical protein K8R91_02910 [Phycisphaerae bacterium]|nr:hypothetical protein [Phycisphaerae bacterium]